MCTLVSACAYQVCSITSFLPSASLMAGGVIPLVRCVSAALTLRSASLSMSVTVPGAASSMQPPQKYGSDQAGEAELELEVVPFSPERRYCLGQREGGGFSPERRYCLGQREGGGFSPEKRSCLGQRAGVGFSPERRYGFREREGGGFSP